MSYVNVFNIFSKVHETENTLENLLCMFSVEWDFIQVFKFEFGLIFSCLWKNPRWLLFKKFVLQL